MRGLELVLGTRKLLKPGRLLGDESLEGFMLPPELDNVSLELVALPDGLTAPVEKFDRGFRLVAFA